MQVRLADATVNVSGRVLKSIQSPDGDIIDCVPNHLQPAFDQQAVVAAGGADIAQGTESETFPADTCGPEPMDIPLKNVAGSVSDGEQIDVAVTAEETAGSNVVSDATASKTLTCHLDANGDGTCS
jgi:hypothetical protein